MPGLLEIKMARKMLEGNDELARRNRERFRSCGVRVVNLMSSPGAGKTALLEATLPWARDHLRVAVVEGDVATARDAQRIAALQVPVVQMNTAGACHLDAGMLADAVESLPLTDLDLLFVENVGNLVCPAAFDLGEDWRVVVLSVTEGADKPEKYPAVFRRADLCLLNKVDLLSYVDFDMEVFQAGLRSVQPGLPVLKVSARTGVGMEAWIQWLLGRLKPENPAGAGGNGFV